MGNAYTKGCATRPPKKRPDPIHIGPGLRLSHCSLTALPPLALLAANRPSLTNPNNATQLQKSGLPAGAKLARHGSEVFSLVLRSVVVLIVFILALIVQAIDSLTLVGDEGDVCR
jgi:hypothetical protein